MSASSRLYRSDVSICSIAGAMRAASAASMIATSSPCFASSTIISSILVSFASMIHGNLLVYDVMSVQPAFGAHYIVVETLKDQKFLGTS